MTSQSQIAITEKRFPYVSRGGLKLEKALRSFEIEVEGKVALDVGCSTGGFIDCLLKHGARQVIGVDVGYGQLAWSLRNDPKVFLLERKNIRHLKPEELPSPVDLVTVDVSFISVKKIMAALQGLIRRGAKLIILVKPQFEAERGLAKKGVVREERVHVEVLQDLWRFFETEGLSVDGVTYSPLAGPEGNLEFFVYLTAGKGKAARDLEALIRRVVSQAHQKILSSRQHVVGSR